MKRIATWLLCFALAALILQTGPSTVNSISVDNSNPQLLAEDPPPPIPPRPPNPGLA
jgi:hypothetical protein